MRPISIVRFELAYLASIVVWLAGIPILWSVWIRTLEAQPGFAGNAQMMDVARMILIGVLALMLLISLALWYFTARRASTVGKWIVTILFALSVLRLPLLVRSIAVSGNVSVGLNIIGIALTGYAVWMLFRPDAQAWFAGSRTPADEPAENAEI
ncbi:hypothetical protein [Sphingomonas sp.]|uniref:hypothetical protein n=1 Tax=Sphingomonas sp. TaxID=28214 RepID=UPI001EBD235B|nr:hypothetical protein [Sphingomonas sp.]MBX3593828.1 hypothetical protein [Sphingomonas sp.]